MKPPKPVLPPERPSAILRVSPTGPSDRVPRDYLIALELGLKDGTDARSQAHALASGLLTAVTSRSTAADGPRVRNLETQSRPDKEGPLVNRVVGVEAAAVCGGWPGNAAIAAICAGAAEQGYLVATEQRRACAEPGCTAEAGVDNSRRDAIPQGWYTAQICGRHSYRACTSCRSVFRLVGTASSGPAPSLHCVVCGEVLVEWGGSKQWEAELVEKPGSS
jgi:hypothetical protein